MTTIAILGATGHIGKALASHYVLRPNVRLALYSRRPQITRDLFPAINVGDRITHHNLKELEDCQAEVVVNAVGIGNPASARNAGPQFYNLTMQIEDQLDRVFANNPSCLTVFLSSGAVYGRLKWGPADETTPASLPINMLCAVDWYGAAKLAAELRHRAQAGRRVLDIRLFGFVSRFLDLSTQYLVCDIVNAICSGTVMRTGSQDIMRDYVGVQELAALIDLGSRQSAINMAVDSYSLEPVGKFSLLDALRPLGLAWQVVTSQSDTDRVCYWSRSRSAGNLGYIPRRKSMNIVIEIIRQLTGGQ